MEPTRIHRIDPTRASRTLTGKKRIFLPALVALLALFFFSIGIETASAAVVYKEGDRALDVGFWVQTWYQYVGKGNGDKDLNDFLIRRGYLSIKGDVTSSLSFFTNLAGDRLGQRALDQPSVGLGSGLAVRDAWGAVKLLDGGLNIQLGRMYVPFTRNYGTTTTRALLITDLDWVQGGYRGSIFYPNTVGRDDGLALWGNVANKRFQYRVMVGNGIDSESQNPNSIPRAAGRVSVSLFEPETGWFNEGSSLDGRRILSIGGGADYQPNLVMASQERNYSAWTVDAHYDEPVGAGALTAEVSYIGINNSPNAVTFTAINSGTDADVVSIKGGYLIPGTVGPGRLQPFTHYERIHVAESANTHVIGLGMNLLLAGHANKATLEATYLSQEKPAGSTSNLKDHFILTTQLAFGL